MRVLLSSSLLSVIRISHKNLLNQQKSDGYGRRKTLQYFHRDEGAACRASKTANGARAINAEIAKMNGLTFSSINASVSELAKAGKELSSALVSLPKTMDTIADDVKR